MHPSLSQSLSLFILACAVVVPIVSWFVWLVFAARHHTPTVGRCHNCDYDLRNLNDTRHCPECGKPFHINDAGDIIS